MRKRPKTAAGELWFVRKYCFAKTYPASDDRCSYVKVKMMAKSSESFTDSSDFKDLDAVFVCRYPDKKMVIHEARLISELDQCPDTERTKAMDARY